MPVRQPPQKMTDEYGIFKAVRALASVVENVKLSRHTDVDQNVTMFQIHARRPGDDYMTVLSVVAQGGASSDNRAWMRLYDRLASDLETQFDRRSGPSE